MQRRNNYNRRSRYRNNNRRRHQQPQDQYAQKRRYQQRWKKRITKFEIGAYVCLKKQREGVGIVKRASKKNTYQMRFKNGAWAWFGHAKISLISEDEYFGASADFIIDESLPSPSPTPIPQYRDVFYSPSPSPSPMPKAEDMDAIQLQADPQQIRFKEPMEVKGNDEILLNEEAQNKQMQIKVDDSPQDTRVPEPKQAVEDEKAEMNEKDERNERDERNEKDQKNEKDEKNELVVDNDEIILMEEEKSDIAEVDAVQTYQFDDDVKEAQPAQNVSKVMKKKQQPKLSKFEKKKKLYYKVKDAREREFLVMCDENRMINLKALHEYIEYFGKEKVHKIKVGHFLNWMQPNARGFVSFSKFVKAIEDDGDVVEAWKRFKKYGNPKLRKTRRVLLAAKRKSLSK